MACQRAVHKQLLRYAAPDHACAANTVALNNRDLGSIAGGTLRRSQSPGPCTENDQVEVSVHSNAGGVVILMKPALQRQVRLNTGPDVKAWLWCEQDLTKAIGRAGHDHDHDHDHSNA